MGGAGIFADDFALDIKDEYSFLLTQLTDEEADEEPVFWFALALIEWKKGRLSETVKQNALAFIESGKDLERWTESGSQKNIQKRKNELETLRSTLCSEPPQRKTIRKLSPIRSPWAVGDLLAHKIVDVIEGYEDYLNKYVLLRVLEIEKHQVSQYFDVDELYYETVLFGLYGWVGTNIPDKSIVEQLVYIPILNFQTYMRLMWFNNSELKRIEMFVLDNDENYKSNTPDFFNHCGPVEETVNVMDIRISEALMYALGKQLRG
jgi:hypothetical protein